MRPVHVIAFLIIAPLVALTAATARAQAIHNLERNFPLEVQDTSPTDAGKWQLQGSVVSERSDTSPDKLTLSPNLQWGFAENAHLFVFVPFYADADGASSGSGEIHAGMLWNFLAEGQIIPSLAISPEVIAPTGDASEGIDAAVTLIATKQITKESSEDRLHLNIRYDYNAVPSSTERENRMEYVAGYSRKITDKTVLILDAFHREE